MPSKYNTNVKPRLEDIKKWRVDGAKLSWIAKNLGISTNSLYRYKNMHQELEQTLDDANDELYEKLALVAEETLFSKLKDRYEVTEEIVDEILDENDNVIKKRVITKRKLVKADTVAVIFALKARKGNVWNTDEKEITQARIEKIKTETKNLEKNGDDLASLISNKLNNYLSTED